MIKVYVTPICPYCVTLKSFLKEHNIEFEEIDVSGNDKLIDEIIEKTGQMGVPVMDINGELIVGFDKEKISKLLDIEE
ncbi:MAG: glutathione S-transferase N-terminal domain-containing protein [Candidatus Nealsonbacteria bacterium]|nr:glutathione S-transferase N-terminal domain-containing protein [Candidatus Nealsonbacteria bacterium]